MSIVFRTFSRFFAPVYLCAIVFLFSASIFAQTKVPEPKDVIGFTPGEDRKLASWNQVVDYFQKLSAASSRVKFEEIGKTTLGNPFVYATISAPENLKNLEKYKQINAKLADPRTFKSNETIAKQLIKDGKTIVLITCGVHSDEVGSYLSSMLIAYKLASATDAETLKILDNTIILLVPALNPDGVDIIKNWYDKTLGTPYEGTDPPELYHKYVGHDDNRDWYAFTQVETQLTVDKIHNVWHPQIVHDIHQQGAFGSRLFLPPYMQPVEPNVPKELVEGYTELGNYMAKTMRGLGFQGITTDSTYDAWTPSRAYSHYHGGVRILSETASCKLATPINVKFDQLREGLGYNPQKETPNFSPVWQGGEWHIGDITNYMTTAAFVLLKHASDNREMWLSRFYAIGEEAVRPRNKGELYGFLLPYSFSKESSNFPENLEKLDNFGEIIKRAGVEIIDNRRGKLIKMAQPYGSFAKAVLEKQVYPNLKDEKGNPIPPYDVTAHTLPLLMNIDVEKIYAPYSYAEPKIGYGYASDWANGSDNGSKPYALYKSSVPVIDEGWTRFVFDRRHNFPYASIQDKDIRENNLGYETLDYPPVKGIKGSKTKLPYKTIIFPDQPPNQILNGYPKGTMPDEYTGGVGASGVKNLRKFVEDGGTLIFLNRASRFAIDNLGLPVRDVTNGLPRKDFYIPGSILRTEINTSNPIAKGMPEKSIAWFEDSPAFEITTSDDTNINIIASYPNNPNEILLSGWALGKEKLAGKAALVSINIGKGKVILFGFRPQYRGQSLATFPLLFNAISN